MNAANFAGKLDGAYRAAAIALLLAAVMAAQWLYDATAAPQPPGLGAGLTPETVRMLDMGFHSTVGSFLWIATMPEILDLFNGRTEYVSGVAYLNAVDPKLSYPYAFSVLTLPMIPVASGYTTGLADAMAIGKRGIAQADPDWRIPYYMATNYYLDEHDTAKAALYFDLAARTPGVPFFARRFAENFGNEQKDRDRMIALWKTIRDTTNDPATKARAQAYVDHLEIFNYLEAAAAQYKARYGTFPANLNLLVSHGIIPAIPPDPFGYQFIIGKTGVVTLNLAATTTVPGAPDAGQ